jgi:hypothetical protein
MSNGYQGLFSGGVKLPGREADDSPPSSADVKECVELYLHSPNTPSWRGTQLKHGDNFTVYLHLYVSVVSSSCVLNIQQVFQWTHPRARLLNRCGNEILFRG